MEKDFYNSLPSMVCELMDTYIKYYGDEEWFPKAWEEYRQHILNSDMDSMRMPAYVFNKYVKRDK